MASSSIGAWVDSSKNFENPSRDIFEEIAHRRETKAAKAIHATRLAVRDFIDFALEIFSFVTESANEDMGKELKIALALAAGALYVYVGIRKGEAPDWTFDVLAIIGVLIVAGALYKLFAPEKRRSNRGAAFERPAASWGPRGRGGSEYSSAGERMTTTLAPALTQSPVLREKGQAQPTGPSAFEPDVLAEWSATLAPGQTSWDSTTLSPKETEIAGFAFGGR
jgi:hypothetical protein